MFPRDDCKDRHKYANDRVSWEVQYQVCLYGFLSGCYISSQVIAKVRINGRIMQMDLKDFVYLVKGRTFTSAPFAFFACFPLSPAPINRVHFLLASPQPSRKIIENITILCHPGQRAMPKRYLMLAGTTQGIVSSVGWRCMYGATVLGQASCILYGRRKC